MSNKWLSWAGALVALQFAFCGALAVAYGFTAPPPLGKYLEVAVPLLIAGAGGRMLWHLRSMPESPIAHLKAADWSDLPGFAGAMVLIWLQFVVLTWGKSMIPAVTSMWADPILADFEKSLLGRDAWQLLPGARPWMQAIYSNWAPTLASVFVWRYFSQRHGRGASLLAIFLTIGLLGTIGQYVLPSGGPIFYRQLGFGGRFEPMLMSDLDWIRGFLWRAYTGQYINYATGISAFPSIHVATSAWIALAVRHWVAYIHLAVIFGLSIILGWHYAVDGVAGIIGAILCFKLATVLLRGRLNAAPEQAVAG